jgi:Ca-activated chloride channel family protein
LRELEDRYLTSGDRERLEKEIVDLSLRFGVLCRFTAYVAVDREEAVNPGGQVLSMVQPVEQPAGWAGSGAAQPMSASLGFPGKALKGLPEDTFQHRRLSLGDHGSRKPRSGTHPPRPSGGARERSSRTRQEPATKSAAEAPSLWQRLLDFLGLGGAKDKAGSGLDRAAKVQQLRELIQRMHGTDVADRLSVLGDIRARKQELFGDLFATGSPRPALERLGQKLLHAEGVLDAPHPDAAAIAGTWDGLLAALTELLIALEAEEAAGSRRGGFWK